MLPVDEWRNLTRDLADAVSLAAAGEANSGLELLLCGLQCAVDRSDADPWGSELASSYQAALRRFCRDYHVGRLPEDRSVAELAHLM